MNGTLAAVAVCASGGTVLLTAPYLIRTSARLGTMTHPRLFDLGKPAVSYLGGCAVAAGVATGFLVARPTSRFALTLLVASGLVLVLGLVDDGAPMGGIPPSVRLLVEVALASAAWAAGLRAEWLEPWPLDLVVTTLVFAATANAVNLLDNMNGVAASSVAATGAGIGAIAMVSGQHHLAVLAAATSVASLVFLRYNGAAARLYLGDNGALFLGFILAGLVVGLRLPGEGWLRPWAALAVLGVGALDTAIVVVSRIAGGRRLFRGGTDHLSHRLVGAGFSPAGVVAAHAAIALIGTGAVTLGVAAGALWVSIPTVGALAVLGLSVLGLREPAEGIGQVRDGASAPALVGRTRSGGS